MRHRAPIQPVAPAVAPAVALAVALALALALGSFVGCASEEERAAREFRKEFESACPKPLWWDDVDVAGVEIHSYQQLLDYWQNRERGKNEFFKAAYQAVVEHPERRDLVVASIKLMPYGDSGYPHTVAMQEIAVRRWFYYARPLNGYGGKTGDSIGGIVQSLARNYNRQGRAMETVELVEHLMDEREHEINDHILEQLTLEYANALLQLGMQRQAEKALADAILKYEGSWEERLQKKLEEVQS